MAGNAGRARKVMEILRKEYPDAKVPLLHRSPLQLLVATILSAQCTDERVNQVTPALFAKYKTAEDFAMARQFELERQIRPTGFYRNKARSIVGCCKGLVQKHGGKVPSSLDDMVQLPGVGRKTANVVLGACYGIPGIVVDTHVKRLSGRLGFTKNSDPDKIEQDLMKIVPKDDWNLFSMLLIFHGRRICNARRPLCSDCQVCKLCPSCECG